MDLADFIETNKQRLIDRWKELAVERLGLKLEESELLNALPDVVDDLLATLRNPSERWPVLESAQGHGRHRLRSGIDIGALTEELALITEVLCELSEEDGRELRCGEVRRFTRVIGRGTAASVNAYAAMRDEELARQASQHFSFIAHELRTPLQTARLAATLLGSGPEASRPRYLQRLARSLDHLTDLVDNSLLRVRLSSTPDMTVQRLDAREIVESACEYVADHAESRGIALTAEVGHFEIDADRKLLVSALTNLLKNAVKFTRGGSRITIRGCVQEARALFEVEDECGGMPEDLPPRLFQPFIQAHADTSGFGLGLMIVKQAAEAHGGSARVSNRPDEGCCFVMDLPLRQSGSAEAPTGS